MTQLFLSPQLPFVKTAAETALPEEPNTWPDAILQELYKQVPYLADFDLEVVMTAVDGERGYGLGHVEVSSKTEAPMTSPAVQLQAAGIRKSRIPVIIKDSKLLPFDVLITDDSKALPLTESRLRQAMFRPQNFDVTSKTPGDQSMIGQLYPPFRQNYGFGGGGVAVSAGMGGKTASIHGTDLEKWLEAEAVEKTAVSRNFVAGLAEKAVASKPGLDRLMRAMKHVDTAQLAHNTKPDGATASAAKELLRRSDNLYGVSKTVRRGAMAEAKNTGRVAELLKNSSVLAGILPTANVSDLADFRAALQQDAMMKRAFIENPGAHDALVRVSEAAPSSTEKLASAIQYSLRPSVEQIAGTGDGMYFRKVASSQAWDPQTEILGRGELVARYGVKVALAADMSGAVTIAPDGAGPVEEAPAPGAGAGPISAPGMYQVQTVDGQHLSGVVITNLLDVDGTALPISLFMDGQHAAVQADISGVPVGEFAPPGVVPAEQARGKGVFYFEAGGIPTATIPLALGATVASIPGSEDTAHFDAQTFDGRQVSVSIQGYASTVVGVDNQMIIPDSWQWIPLDAAEEITLAETPGELGKVASVAQRCSTVEILAGGVDSYVQRGMPVEKLASDDRNFLTQDQALFVLVGCGADPGQAQRKLAQALSVPSRQTSMQVPQQLKLASEVRGESYLRAEKYLDSMPVHRVRMWKEAAVIPDPVAVDTVLSLGFLNPENISAFVGYLPTLDEAQRRMCELLIGARLGLRELPDGALERAVRAVEDVIEGLKVIAFQG